MSLLRHIHVIRQNNNDQRCVTEIKLKQGTTEVMSFQKTQPMGRCLFGVMRKTRANPTLEINDSDAKMV